MVGPLRGSIISGGQKGTGGQPKPDQASSSLDPLQAPSHTSWNASSRSLLNGQRADLRMAVVNVS